MEWQQTDPREHLGKRGTIAICVDGKVFGGTVETKHTWAVWLHPNHMNREWVGPDDEWPKGWRWFQVPLTTW